MTIVVREKEDVLNQIIKHLEKLVNTVEVIDFRSTDNVYREIVLLRIGVTAESRHEVVELCRLFQAQIVDVTPDTLTIEVTGDDFKIDRFLTLMKEYDIQLLTRSGRIAVPKPL
jgi:acetolactate synthase-1/3 small subunit